MLRNLVKGFNFNLRFKILLESLLSLLFFIIVITFDTITNKGFFIK